MIQMICTKNRLLIYWYNNMKYAMHYLLIIEKTEYPLLLRSSNKKCMGTLLFTAQITRITSNCRTHCSHAPQQLCTSCTFTRQRQCITTPHVSWEPFTPASHQPHTTGPFHLMHPMHLCNLAALAPTSRATLHPCICAPITRVLIGVGGRSGSLYNKELPKLNST